MSDDLVKRLRDLGDHASFEPHMHHIARQLFPNLDPYHVYAEIVGGKDE